MTTSSSNLVLIVNAYNANKCYLKIEKRKHTYISARFDTSVSVASLAAKRSTRDIAQRWRRWKFRPDKNPAIIIIMRKNRIVRDLYIYIKEERYFYSLFIILFLFFPSYFIGMTLMILYRNTYESVSRRLFSNSFRLTGIGWSTTTKKHLTFNSYIRIYIK